MIKKISLALLITISYVITVQAQTKSTSKDSTTVIIFNAGNKDSGKKSKLGDNIIKIEPVGFIFGRIPVSYERKLSDLFSIQADIGITTKNYLKDILNPSTDSPFSDDNYTFEDEGLPAGHNDETDELNKWDHRKADLGYLVNLQPRIYLAEDALEGGFIGVSFAYAKFNYTTPGLVVAGSNYAFTGANKKEFEIVKDFMVHYGYQRLYDRITLEYSVGLGIRSIEGEKYMAGGSSSGFYESSVKYKKAGSLNAEIGFKLGFQL